MSRREQMSIGSLTVSDVEIMASISGAGVAPFTPGKKIYLDPTNGSDTNDGLAPNRAVKSFTVAYALTTDGKNDIIFYIAGTTGLTLSATVPWTKSYTHFIGLCAPCGVANRARIFQLSTLTAMDPLITISGSGCIFKNLYIFQGVADATSLGPVKVTGGRNYFENVHFAGIGNATQDVAGAYSLKLGSGGSENRFVNCKIGLDTITRGADTNTELSISSLAIRNTFEDCTIYANMNANTHSLVTLVNDGNSEQLIIFKNCLFLAESINNLLTMASAFIIPANMPTTFNVLQNCAAVGITAWDANSRTKTYVNMVTPTSTGAGGFSSIK